MTSSSSQYNMNDYILRPTGVLYTIYKLNIQKISLISTIEDDYCNKPMWQWQGNT